MALVLILGAALVVVQLQHALRIVFVGFNPLAVLELVAAQKHAQTEKKIKHVRTDLCGWGVEAAESINKVDFVIEYVGEVVDDVECTQRLWAMKNKDVQNFYMCEIKDFTIDATFKGNTFSVHKIIVAIQTARWNNGELISVFDDLHSFNEYEWINMGI